MSVWTTGGGDRAPVRQVLRAAGVVEWELPDSNVCKLAQYSGKVVPFGQRLLKTAVLKHNCTVPPKPGWGTYGHEDIHLFASDDGGRRWVWMSMVVAGNSTGGEEGEFVLHCAPCWSSTHMRTSVAHRSVCFGATLRWPRHQDNNSDAVVCAACTTAAPLHTACN
jgi:hypothetical protein